MRKLIYSLIFISLLACQESDNDNISLSQEPMITSGAAIDPATNASSPEFNIPGNWSLHWSDEFNSFDQTKWEKNTPVKAKGRGLTGRDPNLKWWDWTDDNAWVNNGKLWLRSHKTANDSLACGAVYSKNKFDTKFGYFEAKIKIQNPKYGSHTAFWLQGYNQGNIDKSGADGAEIDIFESVYKTNFTKSVVHIDGYANGVKRASTIKYDTHDMQDGQWHTYGLLWEPGALKIYLDGVLKTTYHGAFVPLVEEYLWLSVGAAFDADNTNSGAKGFTTERAVGSKHTSQVAWVRVWKSDDSPIYYHIKNRQTNKWFKTYGIDDNAEIKQCATNQNGDWTTWAITPTTDGYFYFVNENSGKYIRPINNSNNSTLQLRPTSNSGAWTQWKFVYLSDETDKAPFSYLVNRETGKYIRPTSTSNTAPLSLQPATSTDHWTQWLAEE
jgi:hypothetical protein